MSPSLRIPLLLGVVLGVVFVLFARTRPDRGRRILAGGLVIAAAVYLVFAVRSGDPGRLTIEAGGVALFGAIAWAGTRPPPARRAQETLAPPMWLALGWAAHPIWDVALHLHDAIGNPAPTWYAALCLTFDPIVAAYALTLSARSKAISRPPRGAKRSRVFPSPPEGRGVRGPPRRYR